MIECTHNCKVTPETLLDDSEHYLDCPVWDALQSYSIDPREIKYLTDFRD